MNADDVVNALIDYVRSSDSAIMGSKGPRRKALVKALETFVDDRINAALRDKARTATARAERGSYDG